MVTKRTAGDYIFDHFNVIFLSLLMFIAIYPFLYIIIASFSSANLLVAHQGALIWPVGFSTRAYEAVLQNPAIYIGYKNTVIYVVAGTACNIFMTSLAAFILSRKSFYWKSLIMTMFVITMFFSGGLIPNYLQVRRLGLLDSMWAVILPNVISVWNLMIMKTAFQSIPDSLEEAAKIDGANELYILFRIILPLSLPTIAVMILYYGVGHWNAWFSAMLYFKDRNLFPLQLYLREILISNSMNDMLGGAGIEEREAISETLKYATIIVSTLPILLVYPFLQKYFVKGVMIGAIKG